MIRALKSDLVFETTHMVGVINSHVRGLVMNEWEDQIYMETLRLNVFWAVTWYGRWWRHKV